MSVQSCIFFLSVIAQLLLPLSAVSQSVSTRLIQPHIDRDTLRTGDFFVYGFRLTHYGEFSKIQYPDSIAFAPDFLIRQKIRLGGDRGDSLIYTLQYMGIDGESIPQLFAELIQNGDTLLVPIAEKTFLYAPRVDDTEDALRPMKPIFLLDRSFWFWILMAILAVALAGYLFHRYRALYAQNRETVAVQEEHPSFEDPHKKLTVVLRQLEADFPEPHHHSVNFYTLLGDAFRNYFEEVYRFQAMESISREVLGYLAHIHRDKKILSLAGKIFHKADQVKFARLRPGKRECKNILKQAWKFAGMLEEADRERIDMMRREFEQKPLPDSAQEETKNDLG